MIVAERIVDRSSGCSPPRRHRAESSPPILVRPRAAPTCRSRSPRRHPPPGGRSTGTRAGRGGACRRARTRRKNRDIQLWRHRATQAVRRSGHPETAARRLPTSPTRTSPRRARGAPPPTTCASRCVRAYKAASAAHPEEVDRTRGGCALRPPSRCTGTRRGGRRSRRRRRRRRGLYEQDKDDIQDAQQRLGVRRHPRHPMPTAPTCGGRGRKKKGSPGRGVATPAGLGLEELIKGAGAGDRHRRLLRITQDAIIEANGCRRCSPLPHRLAGAARRGQGTSRRRQRRQGACRGQRIPASALPTGCPGWGWPPPALPSLAVASGGHGRAARDHGAAGRRAAGPARTRSPSRRPSTSPRRAASCRWSRYSGWHHPAREPRRARCGTSPRQGQPVSIAASTASRRW